MEIDLIEVLGYLGAMAVAYYLSFKRGLSKTRKMIVLMDSALADDMVSEEEARGIWTEISANFRKRQS
jgi:hypothetical protein